MSLGSNLSRLRKERKFTQEKLAEKVGVSFQTISAWEHAEYKPELERLMKLAEVLNVSISAIAEEKHKAFKTKEAIYNWEHMKTFVKAAAKANKLNNASKAIDFAVKAHEGQKRKKSDVPYIYHPLNLACHALAMGINDDEVIAACLLHDVVEDCKKTYADLPVNDETKKIVRLLTHEKVNDKDRDDVMKAYYDAILDNPKAALVKCMDRCNNLTTMSWGLSRDRIYRMIKETEEYYPDLLRAVKATPEFNNAAWLLQYQIESMLDIYKRLM